MASLPNEALAGRDGLGIIAISTPYYAWNLYISIVELIRARLQKRKVSLKLYASLGRVLDFRRQDMENDLPQKRI